MVEMLIAKRRESGWKKKNRIADAQLTKVEWKGENRKAKSFTTKEKPIYFSNEISFVW